MITMLVSGLWHGAGMGFIFWGALNGLGLVLHRIYGRWQSAPRVLRRIAALLGQPLTFLWFAFTLIFFRSASFHQALGISRSFLLQGEAGSEMLDPWLLLWFVPLAIFHAAAHRMDPAAAAARVPDWIFSLGLGVTAALALSFVRLEYRPFIYFQF